MRRDEVDDSDAPPSPTTVAKVVAIFALLSGFGVERCPESQSQEMQARLGSGGDGFFGSSYYYYFLQNWIIRVEIWFGLRLRGCGRYSITLCHIGVFKIKWGLR